MIKNKLYFNSISKKSEERAFKNKGDRLDKNH